ncbi:MAG: hypothetical protein H0T70_06885 [Acidimicrobiia bacterium]|nr:hypothetical protein [Acidimicrobiia bacterium]
METLRNKALLGALSGAVVAIVWAALDFGAVLLLIGLAAAGFVIGFALDRPGALIGVLERMQDER